MPVEFTAREISEKIEFLNYNKFKRHSREFLEPDFSAGLSSGVARKFSAEDAFLVYFGGLLVERAVPLKIVAGMIQPLRDFLQEQGYFPIIEWIRHREGFSSDQLEHKVLEVTRCADGEFLVTVEEVFEDKPIGQEEKRQKIYRVTPLIDAVHAMNEVKSTSFANIDCELDMFCRLMLLK